MSDEFDGRVAIVAGATGGVGATSSDCSPSAPGVAERQFRDGRDRARRRRVDSRVITIA